MKEWFVKRGHPEAVTENEIKTFHFSKQGQKSKVEKGVTVVVTHHPLRNKLISVIHRNLYLFYMNQGAKDVSILGPVVSFRSASKIISYVLRVKLYPL